MLIVVFSMLQKFPLTKISTVFFFTQSSIDEEVQQPRHKCNARSGSTAERVLVCGSSISLGPWWHF